MRTCNLPNRHTLHRDTRRFAQLTSRVPGLSAAGGSAGGKSQGFALDAQETGELSHDRDRDIPRDPRGP